MKPEKAIRAASSASACILLAGLLASCSSEQPTMNVLLLNGVTGMVRVAEANPESLPRVSDGMRDTIGKMQRLMDPGNPESDIHKLNQLGDALRLPLSRDAFRALDLGRYYSQLTDGAYDYTSQPLADLWEEGMPDQQSIDDALAKTGTRFVEISENGSIALTSPGVTVNPGELILAYALDAGTVDLRRKAKAPWAVTANNLARREGSFTEPETPSLPVTINRQGEKQSVGRVVMKGPPSLAVRSMPVPTMDEQGHMSGLLIDPRLGRPASGARLAAVAGPLTTRAYALAEALLVLGLEEAPDVMKRFPGYSALVIPDREPIECWMTPGFEGLFVPDPEFPLTVKTWNPDDAPERSGGSLKAGQGGLPFIERLADDRPNEVVMPESNER